jgi:hypothetical protein
MQVFMKNYLIFLHFREPHSYHLLINKDAICHVIFELLFKTCANKFGNLKQSYN